MTSVNKPRLTRTLIHRVGRRSLTVAAFACAVLAAPGLAQAGVHAQYEAKFVATFHATQVETWSIGPYTHDDNCYTTSTIKENGGETLNYNSPAPTRVLAYEFTTRPTPWISWDYGTFNFTSAAGVGGIATELKALRDVQDDSSVTGGPCGINAAPAIVFDVGSGGCQPSHGKLGVSIAQDSATTTILTYSSYPARRYGDPYCAQFYPEGTGQGSLTPIPAKMPLPSAIFSPRVKVIKIPASKTFVDAQSWLSNPGIRIRERCVVDWTITLHRV